MPGYVARMPCSQKNIVPRKLLGTTNLYAAPFASVPLHVSTSAAVVQTGAAALAAGTTATAIDETRAAAPSDAMTLRVDSFM